MKVKDVMHQGATWFGPDASIREIARAMRDQDIGAVPIGENDRLVGMVTDRDIVCHGLATGMDVEDMTARDVMSGPILYCRTEEELDDAAHFMEIKGVRRLPVIDGNKRMVGILSLGDIAAFSTRDMSGEVMEAVTAHHA